MEIQYKNCKKCGKEFGCHGGTPAFVEELCKECFESKPQGINIEFKRDTDISKYYHLSFKDWYSAKDFLEKFFNADENGEVLRMRMWTK